MTTTASTTKLVPGGVLLVGSIPLQSANDVFSQASQALPGRLSSIPDGETGVRHYFISWQKQVFPQAILQARVGGPSEDEDAAVAATATASAAEFPYTLQDFNPTHYDDVALESYAVFRKLKAEGKIAPDVRFQVSLPSPLTVARIFVQTRFCDAAEKLYERRLLEAVRRIQENIPAHELVIQWDVPMEIGLLEYAEGRLVDDSFRPYFLGLDQERKGRTSGTTGAGGGGDAGGSNNDDTSSYPSMVKRGILDRWCRLLQEIGPEVRVGFHLCYGDMGHQHFVQPHDMRLMVDLANDLVRQLTATHPLAYVHMPVPKDQPASGEGEGDAKASPTFFEPLSDLRLAEAGCKLFLGLVHAGDLDGTRRRIDAARAFLPAAESDSLGVTTECGLGRTPADELGSIFDISREVSAPLEH